MFAMNAQIYLGTPGIRGIAIQNFRGLWILGVGFPLILSVFVCIFRLYNRNGSISGDLNPKTP